MGSRPPRWEDGSNAAHLSAGLGPAPVLFRWGQGEPSDLRKRRRGPCWGGLGRAFRGRWVLTRLPAVLRGPGGSGLYPAGRASEPALTLLPSPAHLGPMPPPVSSGALAVSRHVAAKAL
ncbi:hypothetical protein NN561_008967 [Cricetulus griseus]